MKKFNKKKLGKNIINNRQYAEPSGIKKRNIEIFKLTLLFILCTAILWYFVSSDLVDILGTVALLVLYVVLFADIVDYNRALRNVKREISEHLKKNRE